MNGESISKQITELVLASLPATAAWYYKYQNYSLLDAAHETFKADESRQISPPSAQVVASIVAKTTTLLGADTAQRLKQSLEKSPNVLVAQHHGLNSHPEFVQTLIFYALAILFNQNANLNAEAGKAVITVLACSTVALRSYSYPRGLLLGRSSSKDLLTKLPIFSESFGDVIVNVAPTLKREQVQNAKKNWKKLDLLAWEYEQAEFILDNFILDAKVQECERFSDQATIINAKVWDNLFEGQAHPSLVFLDAEDIASDLIIQDLQDSNSILHLILCNPECSLEVFNNLAGHTGCWSKSQNLPQGSAQNTISSTGGTVFFWAINKKGHKKSLYLDMQKQLLYNNDIEIPLTVVAITQALQNKQIIANLFLLCTSLNFVHKTNFLGGIYMVEYLPKMLAALRLSLVQAGYPEHSDFIKQTRYGLGSAIIPFLNATNYADEIQKYPSGIIELMQDKQHFLKQLATIARLQVKDVFPVSIALWYQENMPALGEVANWQAGVKFLLKNH